MFNICDVFLKTGGASGFTSYYHVFIALRLSLGKVTFIYCESILVYFAHDKKKGHVNLKVFSFVVVN